ncbi:MAG: hypothetical protein AB2A00_30675 [Myxococcota bacterium]
MFLPTWLVPPFCALALAQAPSARPRAAAVVEVVPAQAAPGVDESQAAAYYAALFKEGYAQVDAADRAGLTGTLTPNAPSVDDARDALATARARYLKMELPGARAAVEAGIATLLESPNLPSHLALLGKLHLLLGELMLAEGRDVDARRELGLAARLQPDRTLDPAFYPPPVIAAYTDARRALGLDGEGTPPHGNLSVAVEPADVDVLLDGQPLPRHALGVTTVPAGDHYVIASSPGGAARGRRVTVPEGGLAALQLFVPPAGGARDRAQLRSHTLAEAAHRALGVVPASVVVAYSVEDGSVAVAMHGVEEVVSLPPGNPAEQVAEALRRLQTPPPAPEPAPQPVVVTAPPAPPPRVEEDAAPRWPILAAGAMVGGGVGAAALILVTATGGSVAAVVSGVALGFWIWQQNQPKEPARGRIVLGGNRS